MKRAVAIAAYVALCAWIGAVLGAAFAQDIHSHPSQDTEIHLKFYSNWMRPDQPSVSCCDNHDCYPAEVKNVGGTWFAKRREDGRWMAIPASKIEQNRDNPDGRNHVCMQRPGLADLVFCFSLGGGM